MGLAKAPTDENGMCAELSPTFKGERRITLLHAPQICPHCGRCGCTHKADYGWRVAWCEGSSAHFTFKDGELKYASLVMVPIDWHHMVIR